MAACQGFLLYFFCFFWEKLDWIGYGVNLGGLYGVFCVAVGAWWVCLVLSGGMQKVISPADCFLCRV